MTILAYLEARLRPGDYILDVGANVGDYAFAFAASAPVVAVEPGPKVFQRLLRRALTAPARHPVVPLRLALSDVDEELRQVFHFHDWTLLDASNPLCVGNSFSPLRSTPALKEATPFGVSFMRLDTLIDKYLEGLAPAFIKIDVDGHEAKVIKGGLQTLRAHGPALLLEIAAWHMQKVGDQVEDLCRLLVEELGYTLYRYAAESFDAAAPLATVLSVMSVVPPVTDPGQAAVDVFCVKEKP